MGHKKGDKKQMERAAQMKKLGIKRTTLQCPMCHRTISNLVSHLMGCTGR